MTDTVAANILTSVAWDEEGYLVNASDWTPELGEAIAAELGINLTDRHWIVINFAREQFEAEGEAPTIRRITKQTDVQTKELYELFPGGAAKVAARIAGLKKPTGCI
jgi:TusE/DsrC/DsvC family sulfur relay protein